MLRKPYRKKTLDMAVAWCYSVLGTYLASGAVAATQIRFDNVACITTCRNVLMHTIGIVSVLENRPYEDVRNLWKLFERKYGSVDVQKFNHPHISFQGGKTNSLRQLTEDFQKVASGIEPFEIQVSGVGHFGKEVVYLKVEKTRGLIQINRLINQFMKDYCKDLFEHYLPENWVPHITLAMDDLREEDFEKAWAELENSSVEFGQKLHNVCVVKWYPVGEIRVARQYEL